MLGQRQLGRYADRNLGGRFFRADANYAIRAVSGRLEEEGYFYAIWSPANNFLREKIAPQLTLPVGRSSCALMTAWQGGKQIT